MAKKHQNINDYYQSLNTPAIDFYRKIRSKTGASISSIEGWCKGDAATKDPKKLKALSEETGIPIEDLFKKHESNE